MLHAILHGKAGRVEQGGQSLRWRELFKRNEDLLTATFFGRLPYLSNDAFEAVLGCLIGVEQAKRLAPTFIEIELWSRLTEWEERGYVEPDVILRFENELVMIEVKPPFGGGQYQDQWQAQMTALSVETEYLEYEQIHFVALGNTLPVPLPIDEHPKRFTPMTQLEWNDLRRLLQNNSMFTSCRQDEAICQDWMEAFSLFGMLPSAPSWQPLLDYASAPSLDLAVACQQLSLSVKMPAQDNWAPLMSFANGLTLDHHLLAASIQ
ncbi:hypothetical protein ACEUDJ_04335 [Aeromonas bivalvium]|uniref:TnsA endonuclease N-terminal domain-containing protein n=1 Tax=Aeromonas bivalvium TaxID=440079 RepID=A0ABW9GME6_9GAMM|nr:hypothetical protein [Aeromonas hydrophila]BCO14609.1 hypothetical protein RIMD111065_29650 [Aeromonas hydrophila]